MGPEESHARFSTSRKTRADKERSPTNEPRTKMAAGSLLLRCETRDGL